MSRRGAIRGLDRAIAKEARYARGRQRAAARGLRCAETRTEPSMPEFLRNLAFERIENAFKKRARLFGKGLGCETSWRRAAWDVQARILQMQCKPRCSKPPEKRQ